MRHSEEGAFYLKLSGQWYSFIIKQLDTNDKNLHTWQNRATSRRQEYYSYLHFVIPAVEAREGTTFPRKIPRKSSKEGLKIQDSKKAQSLKGSLALFYFVESWLWLKVINKQNVLIKLLWPIPWQYHPTLGHKLKFDVFPWKKSQFNPCNCSLWLLFRWTLFSLGQIGADFWKATKSWKQRRVLLNGRSWNI